MIVQSEDEEEVAGHIDLAERIQVTIDCYQGSRIANNFVKELLWGVSSYHIDLEERIQVTVLIKGQSSLNVYKNCCGVSLVVTLTQQICKVNSDDT